jgi:hypothetical protein
LNDYSNFLLWCEKNNLSLIAFKKTTINQKKLCEYIEKKYKTTNMIENIHNSEAFLQYLKNSKSNIKNKKILLSNLRMTICELG